MTFNCSNCLLRVIVCYVVCCSTLTLQAQETIQAPATSLPETAADLNEIDFTRQELAIIGSFGPWPQSPPMDPGNEFSGLDWAERLGEKLFGDADLSGNQKISCQTCHQPKLGFSDGLPTAIGTASHTRNTQTLWNAGFQHWFGWDGGTDSLWSASLRPLLSSIEMDSDIFSIASRFRNKVYFKEALQAQSMSSFLASLTDEQLVVFIAKTIGAYTRTLVSGQSDFDHFRDALKSGDLTAQRRYSISSRRGLRIFIGEANCHVCHFGPNFSNGEFHDTGRPFFTGVGQVDPGRYEGIKRVKSDRYNLAGIFNGAEISEEVLKTTNVKIGQANFGQWRTPTLRNLVFTQPYMHDGSLVTLRDVVDAYADIDPARLHQDGEAILKPLDLDERGRQDLVNFLKSLSVSSGG